MRISAGKIKALCKKRGMRLNDLLRQAKVSRTAYYYLLRKEDLLPRSLTAIAAQLGVEPSAFLNERKKLHLTGRGAK